MRSVDEHVAAACALVSPLPVEAVPLAAALGRTLATGVVARWDSPPFTNSAMDGYAVHAAQTVGASPESPSEFVVVGESAAGRPFGGTVTPGQAVRIMTGAVMPAGADAVVPVEAAHESGVLMRALAQAAPGAHVRLAGEDAREGAVVLQAGAVLTPARLAALASVGHASAPVRRSPRVAVLATGDELVSPGIVPGPGQIADSNSTLLAALATAAGAEVHVIPRSRDDAEALIDALTGVSADLIVTSGGVSAGAYDVVKHELSQRGVEFLTVAMQPGKPQGLGVLAGTPIACLPGNPVSSLVSFVVFVRPMVRVLAGEAEPEPVVGVAGAAWRSPTGRRQYMPVRFAPDGTVVPATQGGSGSHLVASLATAQALAIVPEDVDQVHPGDPVRIVEAS